MAAAVASTAAGTAAHLVFSPVDGLIRAAYSGVQYLKHTWRAHTSEGYYDVDLKQSNTEFPFANPGEVRSAYLKQFIRGITEVVLPFLAALGWLAHDHFGQQPVNDQVKENEGNAWYHRVAHVVQGPQMRELAFAEKTISRMIAEEEVSE